MQMNDSGHETDDRLETLFFDNLDTSGDILNEVQVNNSDSDAESDIYSKINDFDVVFHDPKEKHSQSVRTDESKRQVASAELLIDKVPTQTKVGTESTNNNRRVLTSDNSTDSYASSIANSSVSTQEDDTQSNQKQPQINTCKVLQRKLELKVERAKRNYRQMYEEQDNNQDLVHKSASLIPISRLPIPGSAVVVRGSHQPLVDVNPSDGNSDEDDLEPVSFFPKPNRKMTDSAHKRQELSDTFSIQEMTIESDQEDELDFQQCRKLSNSKGYKKILNRGMSAESDYLDNDAEDFDDEDSQNLELLPPNVGYSMKEWAQRALCCFRRNDFLS